MSRLCEARPSSRVCNRERITGCRVKRSLSARLRGERPVGTYAERLPRGKTELVSNSGRCAAVALEDLSSDRVVLPAEADAGRPLNRDRYRQRGQARRVGDADLLFV